MLYEMQDRQQCPLCHHAGLIKYLQSYQINLDEAIVLCENKLCPYPLGQSSIATSTFSRSLDNVKTSRTNEAKVKVQDATLALQTKVASHMRKTGHRLQKDAIGIQTGSPQLKKKLHKLPFKKMSITSALREQNGSNNFPLLQDQRGSQLFQNFKSFTENCHLPGAADRSWTSCNGSEGSSDKDSLLNSSGESLESASSASSNSSLGDCLNFSKKTTASYPAFQFGESKTRTKTQSLPCYKNISSQHSNDYSFIMKKDTEKTTVPSLIPANTDSKTLNTETDVVSTVDPKETNGIEKGQNILQNELNAQETDCGAKTQNMVRNEKEIEDFVSSFYSKGALIGKSKAVEKKECLLRYPPVFPQWRNKDALCWLDVILCLAVHNAALKSYVLSESFDRNNVIYRLFQAHSRACQLVKESQGTNSVQSSNASTPAGQTNNVIKDEENHLSSLENQTQPDSRLNNENIVPNETDSKATCLDDYTNVENLLNEAREEVWVNLKSRLKCEKGQNESPVFAFPLLLKAETSVEALFKMEYSFEYKCTKCGNVEKTDHTNTLPSFPAVVEDFNIGDPKHMKKCPKCDNTSDNRTMIYKRLPECMLMHFTEGLPDTTWSELQFGFHGYLYTVTGVVQYINNPDHFIAWLRNPNDNRWFKCDDLRPTVCRYRNKEPKFPWKQVHIVMWERLKMKSKICRQVAIDADDNQEVDKMSGLVSGMVPNSETEIKLPSNEHDNLLNYMNMIGNKVKCIGSNSLVAVNTSPCSTRSTESSDSVLLPNFIAYTPVSESVCRPIPKPIASILPAKFDSYGAIDRLDLPVPQKAEQTDESEMNKSVTAEVSDAQNEKHLRAIENLKCKIESRISGCAHDNQIMKDVEKCHSNMAHSQISGPKTLIEPSTVFCVPKKSSIDEKTPLSSERKSVNENIDGKGAGHSKANDISRTGEQSVNESTNENLKVKANEKDPIDQQTERKESDNHQNIVQQLKGMSDMTVHELELLAKNSEKGGKLELEKNGDLKKESTETKVTKRQTSSSRLSNTSRFKVPFSYTVKPHISRDAFFTLETDNKSRSGSSTPISVSASSSPALGGNLTYLSSVKQYLLSKTTGRSEPKFKFEGLNLKSAPSRSSSFSLSEFDLPLSSNASSNGSDLPAVGSSPKDSLDVPSLSDTTSQSSIESRKSALVNKLIEKLEQRPIGGVLNHTTLKRKLENCANKNSKKRWKDRSNEWDNMSSGNTSLKENSRLNQRQNVNGGKSMKLVRSLVEKTEKQNIENQMKSNEYAKDFDDNIVGETNTKCDSDSVLQDLYEALNIPFNTVNTTMSDIMTDVDDILGIVNVADVVPDPYDSSRSLSCLDGSTTGNQIHSNCWIRRPGRNSA